MNDQFKNFMSVLDALDKQKVKYILVGEVAVYEDLEYEVTRYQNININIATPETLYNLKKDTVRYKDKFDAVYLKDLIKTRKSKVSEKEEQDKG